MIWLNLKLRSLALVAACLTHTFLSAGYGQISTFSDDLVDKGETYIANAKYDSAINILTEAVAYYENGDASQYVRSLSLLGEAHMNLAHYEESEFFLRRSIQQAQKHLDPSDTILADALYYLSRCLGSQGKYLESNENLTEALSIRLNNGQGTSEEVAKIYNLFSYNFRNSAQYDTALYYNNRALELQLELFGEDDLQTASTYFGLGWVHAAKGNIKKSLDLNLRSFQIRNKILGNTHPTTSQSASLVGWCYRSFADYEQALFYYQLALEARINSLGEDHPNVAHSYTSLASIYSNLGNYEKAIFFENQALEIALAKFGPNDKGLMTYYNSVGSSLYKKGEYQLAEENLGKAVVIGEKELSQPHPDLAKAYKLLSRVHEKRNNQEQHKINLEKAREIELLVFGQKHQIVAETHYELAQYYSSALNHDLELVHYRQAEDIMREIYGDHHPLLAQIQLGLGSHFRKTGSLEQALQFSQKSFASLSKDFNMSGYDNPTTKDFSSDLVAIETYVEKAKSLEALSKKDKDQGLLEFSLQTYLEAVEHVEKISNGYILEEAKAELLENSKSIFSGAIAVAFKLHKATKKVKYAEVAFEMFERSKAFTLLKALSDANARKFVGLPDSLVSLERDQRVEIAFLHNRVLREEQRNNTKRAADYKSQLFQVQNQRDSLVKKLEQDYPTYYHLKYNKAVASLEEAQSLLDAETSIVSHFSGGNYNYLLVISASDFLMTRFENTASFEDHIKWLRSSISNYELILESSGRADSMFVGSARFLHDEIFRPEVLHQLDNASKIIIVPDGQLNNVNFEALLPPQDIDIADVDYQNLDYLISKYIVSYAFSCSVLTQGLNGPMNSSQYTLAGYAPGYKSSGEAATTRSEQIAALPGAIDEVESITGLIGGHGWYGTAASETSFKNEAKGYKILHLAMHANLNNANPAYSELLFDISSDSLNDGRLSLAEIYNLQLDAELVVLSACNTGQGLIRPGEGTISLSRAFRYAGVPSIIMSSWQIPDGATNQIMVYLYQNLLLKQSKDDALRNAKLKFIAETEDPLLHHPYFWAGITPIGNMEAIEINKINWWSYVLLVALLVAIVIAWRQKRPAST